MAYQFGDVVLVPFPFTDQSASKQRPGVVVSGLAYHRARRDVILMPHHQPGARQRGVWRGPRAGLAERGPPQALGHQARARHLRALPHPQNPGPAFHARSAELARHDRDSLRIIAVAAAGRHMPGMYNKSRRAAILPPPPSGPQRAVGVGGFVNYAGGFMNWR